MIEEPHNTIKQQNFIQIKEQLYSAKDKPPLFLKKLQEDVQFMKNIMDICFRPTYFQKQHNIILTPDLPALITDVLSSLYQDFIQLLACDKIQKQENELFGLENENQIPNVFDLEDNNKTQQFIMLKQIHLGILQNQPQEAALSYFNKIISRVFYHRPAQIMRFYESSPQIIKNIIQKMNNKIILQLFCKLLQIQSGKQFFKQYKLKYIKYYYKQLISIIQKNNTNTNTNNNTYNNTYNNNQLQTWLEGLLIIHKFLTDKMQEKIDFYKYLNIIIEINKLDFQILKIINNKIQNVGDNQLLLCLKWIQELLKNDGYIMGQPNIKLNLTILNRKNSISNNFYGDQSPSQSNKFHLTQQQLIQICKTIQHSICRYIYNKNQLQNKHNKSQNIIFIYRNLYFLLRIWINYKRQKHMTNKQLINDIVNESFMSKTYDIALQHPFNNSLHNYIKEFIVEALSSKIINPEYFYNAEETYKQIIFMNFPKKKYHKHQNTFYNKVYLIYKELITLYPLHSSMNQINALIKDQQERTSHLIGGDPRKLQTDTLRGSSNGISESSQSYDQFMQFDLCSNKSLGLNSTRTPVVKRSSLATFSEYADKVEAQQQYNKQQNIQQQYD